MSSEVDRKTQERAGYTTGDLGWLEHQFRPRHVMSVANAQVKARMHSSSSDPDCNDRPLAALFAGKGLTQVVSDADKLRRVRDRREKYLESRNKEDILDLLLRLRSTEHTFAHIRLAESNGLSYWFRQTKEDYKENWFLQSSPIRRYFDETGSTAYQARAAVETMDEYLLTMTSPIDFARPPRKKRVKTG